MREFGGIQPLVGEIVGLRTFRVDDTGTLLPLYAGHCWCEGDNVATCDPPTGSHPGGPHAVPDADCECGFYAYGVPEAVQQYRQSRFVLAVVSCWGNVVAGTLGFRAEHARIDAIWLAPTAPQWLHKRLAYRYPSARQFSSREAMLAEYPVTQLECYAPPRRHRVETAGRFALAGAVLGLGVVPVSVLRGSGALWDVWLLATVAVLLTATWLMVGAHWAGHLAAGMVMCGVAAWLIAPLFGPLGWVLRMPLLRGGLLAAGGFLMTLRPRYFPLVSSPRDATFCGVRP